MISSEFFVFITIAILSYGVQIPLLVIFSRKLNGVIVTVYRNLSLGLTMLPVLFFVTWQEVAAIGDHWLTLLLASSIGTFGFVCNLNASNFLPVGVSNSIRQASYVIVAVILGTLFLAEYLTLTQLVLLTGILSGAIGLTLTRSQHTHLDMDQAWKGIGLAVLGGVGYALSFYFFSLLSRSVSPLVAGYLWELGVGLFALLWLLVLIASKRFAGPVILPIKTVLGIAVVSLTTISGTISYGFAVNHGLYALASGLITTTVLISVVMSWVLFKEKLSKIQLALVVFVVVLIFLLRMVG